MENAKKIDRVQPGSPIKAAAWNRIAEAMNADSPATAGSPAPTLRAGREILVKNTGTTTIPSLAAARITGVTETDFEKAKMLAMAGRTVFSVQKDFLTNPKKITVALEPIAPGAIGKALYHGTITPIYLSGTDAGPYISERSDGKLVVIFDSNAVEDSYAPVVTVLYSGQQTLAWIALAGEEQEEQEETEIAVLRDVVVDSSGYLRLVYTTLRFKGSAEYTAAIGGTEVTLD